MRVLNFLLPFAIAQLIAVAFVVVAVRVLCAFFA